MQNLSELFDPRYQHEFHQITWLCLSFVKAFVCYYDQRSSTRKRSHQNKLRLNKYKVNPSE